MISLHKHAADVSLDKLLARIRLLVRDQIY